MSEADGMREALIDIIKDTQIDVTTATNSVGPMGRVPYISDEQAAISADAILRLVSLGEPVAWRWRYGDDWYFGTAIPSTASGRRGLGGAPDEVQPLYARPLKQGEAK